MAIKISNPIGNSADIYLKVGQDYSGCRSPESDPRYPIPEFSTLLIPVIGTIILFFIMRRKYKK